MTSTVMRTVDERLDDLDKRRFFGEMRFAMEDAAYAARRSGQDGRYEQALLTLFAAEFPGSDLDVRQADKFDWLQALDKLKTGAVDGFHKHLHRHLPGLEYAFHPSNDAAAAARAKLRLEDPPLVTEKKKAQNKKRKVVDDEWEREGVEPEYKVIGSKRTTRSQAAKELNTAPRKMTHGHAGIPIGATFESRSDASQAGVHAPIVAGIHSNQAEGAYSIAVSGGYEDNVDAGFIISYSGAGGRELDGTNGDKNLRVGPQVMDQTFENACNYGLMRSAITGNPVRVLRGFKGHSCFAPDSGYRYDGLYNVVHYGMMRGASGHDICQFVLVRQPDQGDIPARSGREHEAQSILALQALYRDTSYQIRAIRTRPNTSYGHMLPKQHHSTSESSQSSRSSPGLQSDLQPDSRNVESGSQSGSQSDSQSNSHNVDSQDDNDREQVQDHELTSDYVGSIADVRVAQGPMQQVVTRFFTGNTKAPLPVAPQSAPGPFAAPTPTSAPDGSTSAPDGSTSASAPDGSTSASAPDGSTSATGRPSVDRTIRAAYLFEGFDPELVSRAFMPFSSSSASTCLPGRERDMNRQSSSSQSDQVMNPSDQVMRFIRGDV